MQQFISGPLYHPTFVGFQFFFHLPPGSGASAPPPGALLNFCGKFLVFDVQSSTTEKEQTVSYPMFLKIGAPVSGAGTDQSAPECVVWDSFLPVFQRLRVLSRIVDWIISYLGMSEIEKETSQ